MIYDRSLYFIRFMQSFPVRVGGLDFKEVKRRVTQSLKTKKKLTDVISMLASFGVYLSLFGHRFTMKWWNGVGATWNFTVKENKTLKTVLILLQLISWEEASLSSVQGQYGCRGGLCYWVLELSRVSPGEMQHWRNEERGPWQDIKSSRGTNGRVGDRERASEGEGGQKQERKNTSQHLALCCTVYWLAVLTLQLKYLCLAWPLFSLLRDQ